MAKPKTNPEDNEFLKSLKGKKVGDEVEVSDGVLYVEAIFDVPTHFNFHQRIFQAGMILKKKDSNVRIYIEAEKLGLKKQEVPKEYFVEKKV